MSGRRRVQPACDDASIGDFAQILPLAITMMAGPQILSQIIFVTGERPVSNSVAFLLATAVSMTVMLLLWLGLGSAIGDDLRSSGGPSSTSKVIETVLVGLLILASIRTYLGRETAEPPKWMGKLQEATPGRAFGLALVLMTLMPSDFVIVMTAGIHLTARGLNFWDGLPFIGLTVLIAALPLLFYLLFHRRAVVTMPKVRQWMNEKSWLVNIIVFGIFIVLILK
jgi:hypothetical protein